MTVQAALYGPYAAPDAITCADAPAWTGSFAASGDGTTSPTPVTLTVPGYYTYRESIAATTGVAAVETACGGRRGDDVVRGAPAITTQVSAQETAPGAQITDTAVVTGLGGLAATVHVELWGPFPTRDGDPLRGHAVLDGHLAADRRRHLRHRAGRP